MGMTRLMLSRNWLGGANDSASKEIRDRLWPVSFLVSLCSSSRRAFVRSWGMGGRTFIQARLATIGLAFIATLIGVALFGLAWPAIAQDEGVNIFGYSSQPPAEHAVRRSRANSRRDVARRQSVHKKSQTAKYDEAKKSAPHGAVYAIVSLADQRVTVYDSTGRIGRSQISSGIPGHPTPIGLFSIIGKERWHRSNIYSGAPMPFMQRITWSGVAMHLGVVPGHPASHGCIRLPDGFAQQFWGMTQIGSRVVIARQDAVPDAITSAVLPAPKMRPAPETFSAAGQSSPTPLKLASISETATGNGSAQTPASTANPAKLLNPIEFAKVLRERSMESKAAAERAAKSALSTAQAAGAQARQAMTAVAKYQAELNAADTKLLARDRATISGTDRSAKGTSGAVDVDRLRAVLTEAQTHEADTRQAAFAAVQTWKEAVAAAALAEESVNEAERRLKPVSVLFSKKESRVFIRQDWKEVYEAPITFKDPERPIGTHLFIAVNADADGKLTWSAISVPSGRTANDNLGKKHLDLITSKRADPALPPHVQGDTASAALERVEMADEVRQCIADLVWVGAQVIITDNARSDEMDSDSDFIVSTR
jgi:hypothetical protein